MTFLALTPMSDVPHDRPEPKRDQPLDRSWHCAQTIVAHDTWVRCVAVSPNCQWIASASGDRTVKIWSAQTGKHSRTLRRHSGWVRGVAFSPDNQTIASVSSDRTLRLWDVQTGELRRTWLAHEAWVGAVAFSPDGQLIATGSQDRTIKIWHIHQSEPLHVLAGHTHWIRALAFSADGRYLVSGSRDRTIRFWQVATGASSQPLEAHNGEVWSVAFDPHHFNRVASCGADGIATLWKWTSGDQLGAFNPPATIGVAKANQSTPPDQQNSIPALTTLAFHPTQPILATAGQAKTICLWQSTTAQLLDTLTGHRSWIWSVEFSSDGQFLVSGDWEGLMKIWRPIT